MLTAVRPSAPGIIRHAPQRAGDAARRRQSVWHTIHRRSSAFGGGNAHSSSRDNAIEVNGISIDRLTYISTALDALPGVALREYFVPIVRLKKQLLLRQRNVLQRFPSRDTVEGAAAYAKMVTNALTSLTRALNTAGGDLMLDGGAANLSLEPKDVIACLKDKVAPVSIEAGGVLVYPREPPEASFVYIIVAGTVSATFFQPQTQAQCPAPQHQRRGGGFGVRGERRMYFTSAKDVVHLCGGGLAPEVTLAIDDYAATDSIGYNNSAVAGGGGTNMDGASMSNVTTAIQRSLRRASRTAGQPTLRPIRTEQVCGPAVLGAGEALGLAPFKYVCYTVSTTSVVAPASGSASATSKGAKGDGGATYVEFVDAFRIRTSDVHAAVIEIAAQQRAERLQRSPNLYVPWCAAAPGEVVPRGAARTVADFIVAARHRALYSDYAATELLVRQSWLLQDTAAHTIRALMSHMVPRTYMPGEVMACPHMPGSARQLCFLRRGRLNVFVLPKSGITPALLMTGESPDGLVASRFPCDGCGCWRLRETPTAQPAEVVESGASFGELSVLFNEPRHCILRADTVCDVWCLPRQSFVALMQRDAALRDGLLRKAAVLRVEWMSEQRFTRALAQQLRAGSELLKPLPDIAIRLIQERLEPVIYTPGSLVASTSTRCTEMTFIRRGTVSTICEGVATYGPGDVLGEGCLIPHRWPLGLAARTMVEGWRIKVNCLIDALRRMDLLYRYSGLVTSQTPQLMKQIFGTPQPEIEVDTVGRQRMPTVGAPPGGSTSYLMYGRAVSEVQLKALCFLYRGYVRWEDISYSTTDRGADRSDATLPQTALDAVARDVAISRLSGRKGQQVSVALSQLQQRRGAGVPGGKHQKTVSDISAVASGSATTTVPLPTLNDTPAAAGSGRNTARANNGRRQPTRPPRVDSCGVPRQRLANAGAFLVKQTFLGKEVPSKAATLAHGRHSHLPLPPRLHRMVRLLEERDRTWTAEQCHEAALAQEINQRDAAVWNRAALRSKATASTSPPEGKPSRFETEAATVTAMPVPRTAASALSDTSPAPVHIFLQGERPRYELALSEAIAVGYVMQLPDIAHIQHSVSMVDPDVALGPPAQRGRRHLMSVTPNDRYTKHNFLFAAADLKDGNSAETQQKAAEVQAEAKLRSKTRKLFTMMRTAVASRMDSEAAAASAEFFHPSAVSGDYSPTAGSTVAPPPDTLVLLNESQMQSLDSDAEGLTNSPAAAFTPSPDRPRQQQALRSSPGIVVRADSMATQSSLCGSPSKSSGQKKEEAFQRLVQRDPAQAIELLCKHYDIPWSFAWANPQLDMAPPAQQVRDGCSVTGSGYMTSPVATSVESQRRAQQLQRPSLLERLETVAMASMPSANATGGLSSSLLALSLKLSGSTTDAEAPQRSEAGTEDGGVLLTDNRVPSYPQLVRATARDRWHSANCLTAGSAPPLTSEAPAPLLLQKVADANVATPSATAKAAAPGAGLVEHFYRGSQRCRAPALFVEGYGPLQPVPEYLVEYPPTIHASAVGGGEPYVGNGSIGRAGGNGARFSRPPTSMAAAAVLRRSASRQGGVSGSFCGGDGSHQRYPFRCGSSSPFGNAGKMGPRKEEFIMPDAEATEMLIRRIQRDVDGLNEVAKEQRRERDRAHTRDGRAGRYLTALEATLGKPNKEELELLEAWRMQYRHIGSESLRRASLPVALRTEAGQDYMKQELEYLADTPAPMDDPVWRYASGVQEWQDQQAGSEEGTSLFCGALATGGSGADELGGGAASALDGARRVVATIGSISVGFTPAPLQSPSAHLSPGDYEAWVRQREDFFAAYKCLLDGHGEDGKRGGWTAEPAAPLAAPKPRFTPAPPSQRLWSTPATPAPSRTPPSEAPAEQPADFRMIMDPRSEDSDADAG
ncbi:Flagellar Member 6 [Leishmania donovani]|uniref:Flagellar Member 6 n=1 Tax=Leishmania donovani TaxID=5661 RepID=A0A3Q8IBF2_LEIDO|nr:Flagellar Member 6 [Leishmania donovani]